MNDLPEITCPACGSAEVAGEKRFGYAFLLSFFLFGIPVPFGYKLYHCFDCGKDFKQKKRRGAQ